MWRVSWLRLMRDERGLSTVEYTVLLVLIVTASVTLWQRFGSNLTEKIGASADTIGKLDSKPEESSTAK